MKALVVYLFTEKKTKQYPFDIVSSIFTYHLLHIKLIRIHINMIRIHINISN